MKTYRIITLGCKIARADTANVERMLQGCGFVVAEGETLASLCCVVGCAVTGVAEGKSRRALRKIARENEGALLVAVGCIGNMEDACNSAGVDLRVEPENLDTFLEQLEATGRFFDLTPTGTMNEVDGFTGRTRAFLKVQDGCKGACSYCLVHKLRGRPRSIRINEALQKAQELIAFGHTELVLSGVRLGMYEEPDTGATLYDLINALTGLENKGLLRLRLSSIEPMDFDMKIIRLIKERGVLARSLHLPVQSGDDEILRQMNRPYTTAEYAELISKIRAELNDAAIMTDVIAGFPGETDAAHGRSLEFMRSVGFSRMHVFPFSPRIGTPAESMDGQVEFAVAKARTRELIELGEQTAETFRERFIGRSVDVIAQPIKRDSDMKCGYTSEYVRVEFAGREVKLGEMVRVQITANNARGLVGDVAE